MILISLILSLLQIVNFISFFFFSRLNVLTFQKCFVGRNSLQNVSQDLNEAMGIWGILY